MLLAWYVCLGGSRRAGWGKQDTRDMSDAFELKTEKTNPEYAMSDYSRWSKCFGVITESRYRSAEHERAAGEINAVIVMVACSRSRRANSNIESLSVVGSVPLTCLLILSQRYQRGGRCRNCPCMCSECNPDIGVCCSMIFRITI